MNSSKWALVLAVMLQLSLSSLIVASMLTGTAAEPLAAEIGVGESAENTAIEAASPPRPQRRAILPQHRRLTEFFADTAALTRGLEESLGSTAASSDDDEDDEGAELAVFANGTGTAQANIDLCTPTDECELCPYNWKVLNEREEERIKGEYESCEKFGRRRQFECTVLFQETESSEKIAGSTSEYRPCQYTEADEQYRMLRMQMICLLIGVWAMRNVRRQRVVSASLFDQRRMRAVQSASGGGGAMSGAKTYTSPYEKKNSLETVELVPLVGAKVPKSPAPNSDSIV
ncbi:hypothetical protein ACHAXT_002489 [Thalassiosira profunda]